MRRTLVATVVENDTPLTLTDLCHACRAPAELIHVWVAEGVLQPQHGDTPTAWRFAGATLRRARVASRLARDLELNPPGVALALDLMERIEALEARLRRAGGG